MRRAQGAAEVDAVARRSSAVELLQPPVRMRLRRAGAADVAAASRQISTKRFCTIPSFAIARGYIIPSDQADFPTATKFVDTLLKNGITVMKATAAFTVNGKNYPAGSYVIKTAQAFRPHILDMFEPQDHPNDLPLSRRSAHSSLRHCGLDARLADGRAVRPHPRRFRRPVHEN